MRRVVSRAIWFNGFIIVTYAMDAMEISCGTDGFRLFVRAFEIKHAVDRVSLNSISLKESCFFLQIQKLSASIFKERFDHCE